MKTIKLQILCFFLIASMTIVAQQANQKIEMKLDAIGNAKITISMTMNATRWQQWNNNYGNNPAALKRDIERGMPAFMVDDFNWMMILTVLLISR